jgi:hypothetical protein
MTFLKKNKEALLSGMTENPQGMSTVNVDEDRKKMTDILTKLCPKPDNSMAEAFRLLEEWWGHDLLVNAIMLDAKGSSGVRKDKVYDANLVGHG